MANRPISGLNHSPSRCQTCKILVLGAPKVGKDSLITAFLTGSEAKNGITDELQSEYVEKKVALEGYDKPVNVAIWNLPGGVVSPREVTPAFYKGAHGCLLVCSTVDKDSFSALADWYAVLCEQCGGEIPIAVSENKIDQIEHSVLDQKNVETMAKRYKFRLYRTSAIANLNVEAVFMYLIRKSVERSSEFGLPSRPSSIDFSRSYSMQSSWESAGFSRQNSASTIGTPGSAVSLPSKRRTGGVKPVFNKHSRPKNCALM